MLWETVVVCMTGVPEMTSVLVVTAVGSVCIEMVVVKVVAGAVEVEVMVGRG